MPKIPDSLFKALKALFDFLFIQFRLLFYDLQKKSVGIPKRKLVYDAISIIQGMGVFGLLNCLALLVFIYLPQGKDVLLVIVEEVGNEYRFGNLLALLAAIFLWSIVSEFGSRYAIYVTDNSGKNLDDKRVAWRKSFQRTVAAIFLMLPYLIILLGFAINYLQDDSLQGKHKNIGFGVPVLCVYLLFSSVTRYYFSKKKNFFSLPASEKAWCEKLYGIYNEYIFTLRKPSNFEGKSFEFTMSFWNNLNLSQAKKEAFPQNEQEISAANIVPKEFEFQRFTRENGPNGQMRWIYYIPLQFYKKLHHQLKIISICCLSAFLFITFLPIRGYEVIGAPALLVLAFACYSGIYIGLLFLDYGKRWNYTRILLLLLLLISSYLNKDHPVRYNEKANLDQRPELKAHFEKWFDEYGKDSNTLYMQKTNTTKFSPVVFVCAEGGALRTGAFAALTLDFLRDSLLTKAYDSIDLRKAIYAYSGVSGGSLGISFFNAVNNLASAETDFQFDVNNFDTLSHVFFNQDYLSPVIGSMFYGDLLNEFFPIPIQSFDRAIAIEKSWEKGYNQLIRKGRKNIFSADFQELYNTSHRHPVLLVNTTEVETGLQCWLSNVKLSNSTIPFAAERDLLASKIRGGINFSTMINFSSRFPLFSPAATLHQNDDQKFHYVDGGYVENTGCGTMLELLQELRPLLYSKKVRPYILVLRYTDDKKSKWKNLHFGNEYSEIVSGIYNTRGGKALIAQEQLRRFADSLQGAMIEIPLSKTGSEVPMNWTMSGRSLDRIKEDVKQTWDNRMTGNLKNLLYFNPTEYLMRKRWKDILGVDSTVLNTNRKLPKKPNGFIRL